MQGNSGYIINPTFNFTTNQNFVQGAVRPYSAAKGYSQNAARKLRQKQIQHIQAQAR